MKKVSTLCMIIATTLFFGCEGPEGPLGPQGLKGDQGEIGALGPKGDTGDTGPAGADGTNGTDGQDGTNGQDGNANVVYSEWMSPTWANNGNNVNYVYFDQRDKSSSLLTQEAIDKGVVYSYVKVNALDYNADTREYSLVERISPNGGTSYFKIPGRATNEFRDFARSYIFVSSQIGVNYLNVGGDMYKLGWDENYTNSQTPIEELKDQSFSFYNDLTKDIYQYRTVVVYGSTQGRTNVDMSDYEAVKRAYNIPD